MGLLLRRRRPVMRLAAGAAAVGVASRAGRSRAAADAYNEAASQAYAATTRAPLRPTQPRPPESTRPTDTDRAARLIRGLEASVAGDSSVVADLYTDDVRGWSPAMHVSSAAELAIELEDDDDAFSDVELAFAPLDVSGDRACVEWTMTATHSGPIAVDDEIWLQATGLRLTLRGVTIAEFAGDRIRSFRQYWDEGELLAQVLTAGN